MVVILAGVTSKSGKALFARQFTEMTRVRVEGLLSAFPKLMDSSSQHTYVETETVRYVYQPMEKLYLLLVTNKSSNIIEDLDTLQLLSLIIKDKLETISDEEVVANAYELMFAFDEVINLGYREYLGLDQVNTILEMDSHEEALQKLIYETKLDDARRAGKDAEARIKKSKKEGSIPSGRMTGISSSDLGMSASSNFSQSSSSYGSNNDYNSNVGSFKSDSYSNSSYEKKEAPKKSLKLGSSKKKVSLLENLVQQGEVQRDEDEEEVDDIIQEQKQKNTIPTEKVHMKIEEEAEFEINRQGTVTDIDIKGHMFLVISEKDAGFIRVHMNEEVDSNFTPKTHPNLDKKLYSKENALGLKNTSKSFPTGNPLKVLQWTSNSKENSLAPFSVTCWPSANGSKGVSCTLEYELKNEDIELNDVKIIIPVPNSDVTVEDVEFGTYSVKNNILTWQLDHITSDSSSGTLEFEVPSGDENSFFPISVQFSSLQTISNFKIDKVTSTQDDEEVIFSSEYSLIGNMTIQ
eukprot:gene8088-12549_t